MNNNELFELCKQVYEATGWREPSFGGLIPTYTSDYLLEKLGGFDLGGLLMEQKWYDTGDIWWGFGYENGDGGLFVADTPLKSLLKLTLALHKAGEL